MGNTKSEHFFLESQKYIPGGVNSPVRSFAAVEGTPRFIASGKGSHIWDIDDDSVVDALQKTAKLGTSFGTPTVLEIELAKLICDALPSVDSIRLVSSGTEACMSAIRLARAYTKRDKLIKFSGCYHGHSDGLLVKAGSGAMTHGVPTSAGVPESYAQETLLADYNDLESVSRLYDQYPNQIAGVIVEPVAGNMGVVPPRDGFLSGLRDITTANESLLIFDEVITGFRVAYGGAQNLYGIAPDITCLGKIIGGGLPVGAYSGRREIMEQVAPLGPMYQAGTLSGNPLAVVAGITTLLELQDPQKYKQIDLLAKKSEMTQDEYKAKADELRKKVVDYQTKRRDSLEKIAAQRAEARKKLLDKLDPILNKYSDENGYTLILDKKKQAQGLLEQELKLSIISNVSNESDT